MERRYGRYPISGRVEDFIFKFLLIADKNVRAEGGEGIISQWE
jgi:hypothetical protein